MAHAIRDPMTDDVRWQMLFVRAKGIAGVAVEMEVTVKTIDNWRTRKSYPHPHSRSRLIRLFKKFQIEAPQSIIDGNPDDKRKQR